MKIFEILNKHFKQIRSGGVSVIIKKVYSTMCLILQSPVYFLSFPAVLLIRFISPWFLIRWGELRSSRIGHLTLDTSVYFNQLEEDISRPKQRFLDCFYLMKYVANRQLLKMLRRKIVILPRWILLPLDRVNIFIPGGKNHNLKKIFMDKGIKINLQKSFSPHINLTDQEKLSGENILKKFGFPDNLKFVCLIVRDSAYLDKNKKYSLRDWSYHNHRNGDINRYILAAEELTKRGYYVFRMGTKDSKPMKSSNSKIFDYANSEMRSDFMDIYLGINCSFCISTGLGFDEIPRLFHKPIANIYAPLVVPYGYLINNNDKDLIITKHHLNKKSNKALSISEIFSSNVASSADFNEFKLNEVELQENSPDEIKDLAVEMDDRLKGTWKETEEEVILQRKFWTILDENMKKLNIKSLYKGKPKAKFGAKYLKENQNWIV